MPNNQCKLKRNVSISTIETNKRTKKTTKELDVLIVDDNPINIEILKKSLHKIFNQSTVQINQIEEANHGVEAIRRLNQQTFDIILLDIDMPILNGIDTTKLIRSNGETTPIIAVTTNDSTESIATYLKIGMNGCLSKPVDIKLLEKILYKVLLLLPQCPHDPSPPPPPFSPCCSLPPSPADDIDGMLP